MTEVQSPQGGARVRVPPPLVFLAAIVLGIVLGFVLPWRIPLPGWVRIAVPVALIGGGLAIGLSARRWFSKTGQDPRPWLPSPELIVNGPYRFSRNPLYLTMLLLSWGIAIAAQNVWIFLLGAVALRLVHHLAVLPEEAYLADKFGEQYLQYKARVRRYL
jgi:protein-S-isoprenylcysteine O-methyltransferase Ste14